MIRKQNARGHHVWTVWRHNVRQLFVGSLVLIAFVAVAYVRPAQLSLPQFVYGEAVAANDLWCREQKEQYNRWAKHPIS
jgi:hypothetical protein